MGTIEANRLLTMGSNNDQQGLAIRDIFYGLYYFFIHRTSVVRLFSEQSTRLGNWSTGIMIQNKDSHTDCLTCKMYVETIKEIEAQRDHC